MLEVLIESTEDSNEETSHLGFTDDNLRLKCPGREFFPKNLTVEGEQNIDEEEVVEPPRMRVLKA